MQPASLLFSFSALWLLTLAFPTLMLDTLLLTRQSPRSLLPVCPVGFRGGGGVGRLLSPRQHPSSSFKSIATLSAATTKELLLGAPFFAFKVYERKREPSSWQGRLVPYIKTCWSIIRRVRGAPQVCVSSERAPQCSSTPTGVAVRCLYTTLFMVYSLHSAAESE